MPPANSFKSIIVWVWTSLKNFKMTAMADYGTTFAIINLPIAAISPTKFRFNQNFRLVRDFVSIISRWLTSLTSEWNEFSIFKSLCCPDTAHKVSVQSIIKFWRGQFHIVYEFQDGCDGGHLGKQNGTITAILNLNVA